tara:strand:- start:49858 stop:52203 length:2346 start_codon:yes stop_codon:yes gene_type:complete
LKEDSVIRTLKRFFIYAVFIMPAIVLADGTIERIEVKGNVRVDPSHIISVADLRVGQFVNDETLNGSLKKLYKTGLFRDLVVDLDKGVLMIRVAEYPTINDIAFEGNSGVKEKLLKTKMKIEPRATYTEEKIKYEVQRLLAIYRSKGFFSARVFPKIIKRDYNRVDVVFEIEEGDPAKIHAINFVGNKDISDWDLSAAISTKESAWWKFFSSDDFFDQDKLEIDREQLKKYYLNRGYVDFRVQSVTAQLMRDYRGFIITFNLHEGQRYKFGTIQLENQIKGLDLESLEKVIKPKDGDWYSAQDVETMIDDLTDAVTKQGFSFVDISPTSDVDEKNHKMNITLIIKPAPRIFINQIHVKGNERTVDAVIRRELSFAEGDPLNQSKLRNSERRLNYLGFFKEVKIDTEKVKFGESALRDATITVKEQSTGDINFSIGFATLDGPLGMIRLAERNLFGRGYELSSALEIAKKRKSISADFINPNLFGRDLAYGVGIFGMKVNRDSDSSYSEKSIGIRNWISYFLTEHLIQRWSYQISRDEIGTPGTGVYPLIAMDKGKFMTSAVGHDLSLDYRDNRLKPTDGYLLSLGNEFAGVGGKVKYLKNTLSGAYYQKLTEKVILELHAQAGMMSEVGGRRIRVSDKFMMGGNTLRGFDYSGVGPHGFAAPGNRTQYNESSLGGDRSIMMSAQVNFPLGLPEDMAVSGHTFIDAGTLWDSKIKKRVAEYNRIHTGQIGVYNSKKIRSAAGLGVSWASPMGVITIDYGHAITSAKGDEKRAIIFSMGSSRF